MEITEQTKCEKVKCWMEAFRLIHNSSFTTTRACFYKIRDLELKEQIKPNDYFQLACNSKDKYLMQKCISFVLNENQQFLSEFKAEINEYNRRSYTIEKFINENEWKKTIIDELTEMYVQESKGKAREPEAAVKQRISVSVLFLSELEKFILSNYEDIPSYLTPIRWYFSVATKEMIEKCLICYGSNVKQRCLTSRTNNPRHKSEPRVSHGLGLLKRLQKYIICDLDKISKISILRQIDTPKLEKTRNFYYKEEIDLLYEGCLNFRDKMMICFLEEIGLRAGALSCLTIEDIFSSGSVKDQTTVIEKQAQNRSFLISEKLKNLINSYFQETPEILSGKYLFPQTLANKMISKNKHVKQSTLLARLKAIAKRVNVNGPHVHMHSFRHTIVDRLMAEGNTIENVSKFIGHKHISTTEQYYWNDDLTTIIKNMNISWLNTNARNFNPHQPLSTISGSSVNESDMYLQILIIIVKLLTFDQLSQLHQLIPNFNDIINKICSVYASTVSSASSIYGNISDFADTELCSAGSEAASDSDDNA